MDSAQCYMKPHVGAEVTCLLGMFNMHHELRLNVTLEMNSAKRLGALINYSGPFDEYTRFMVYVVLSRTHYLPDEEIYRLQRTKPLLSNVNATHVIILVNYGIDVVVALQLPSNDTLAVQVDDVLNQLCKHLKKDYIDLSWINNAEKILRNIEDTVIFSNIPALTEIKTITDFYRRIFTFKDHSKAHPPYNYNLSPINYLCALTNQNQMVFQTLELRHIELIEYHILKVKYQLARIKRDIDKGYLHGRKDLSQFFGGVSKQWSKLDEMYAEEIQRVRAWLIDFRVGAGAPKTLHDMLDDQKAKALHNQINDLSTDLAEIKKKERFISELLPKELRYRNAADYGVEESDDEQTLGQKLMDDDKDIRILCGTDDLYEKYSTEWNQLLQEVTKDRKNNPHARWIYADFSYCSKKPDRLKILPAVKKENNISAPQLLPTTASEPAKTGKQDDIFNVLLIGESGVGKSTFINAFVNYLQFDTFEKAQQSTPIVLLPISFIITQGAAFEEQRVVYDGLDKSSNEDHEHPGQSVTQHCKSYLFTLKYEKYRGRQMRLIDTPGIGDVRGTEQDDRNMQDILAFINNLTHLHAICIVMKPNVTRLNVVFRSCLIQLLDLLGEKARDHVLFCFTNTRATFYGPGDTAPVLKKLLASLPGAGVPFGKANSFCFDSESFRYLVAKNQDVRFENDQIDQYEASWKKSSEESSRLFERVSHDTMTYRIDHNRQSRIGAQLKINLMLRPILEAMRNILRNIASIQGPNRPERPSNYVQKWSKVKNSFVVVVRVIWSNTASSGSRSTQYMMLRISVAFARVWLVNVLPFITNSDSKSVIILRKNMRTFHQRNMKTS